MTAILLRCGVVVRLQYTQEPCPAQPLPSTFLFLQSTERTLYVCSVLQCVCNAHVSEPTIREICDTGTTAVWRRCRLHTPESADISYLTVTDRGYALEPADAKGQCAPKHPPHPCASEHKPLVKERVLRWRRTWKCLLQRWPCIQYWTMLAHSSGSRNTHSNHWIRHPDDSTSYSLPCTSKLRVGDSMDVPAVCLLLYAHVGPYHLGPSPGADGTEWSDAQPSSHSNHARPGDEC